MRSHPAIRLLPSVMGIALLLIASSSFAGNPTEAVPDERPVLVATTSVIADLVTTVADGRFLVVTVIPAGQDPHSYQPPPSVFRQIERASIVLTNGLGLEEGILDTIDAVATGLVIELTRDEDQLQPDDEHDHDDEQDDDHATSDGHGHGDINPHVWLDPLEVVNWVAHIQEALIALDPDGAGQFRDAAVSLTEQLVLLDQEIGALLGQVPEGKRRVAADHDSLSHFAERYDIEVAGHLVEGFSASREPSPGQVVDLFKTLRDEDIRVFVVSESVTPSTMELIESVAASQESAISVITLRTGSLAAPGDPADSYLGYMRQNALILVNAIKEGQ